MKNEIFKKAIIATNLILYIIIFIGGCAYTIANNEISILITQSILALLLIILPIIVEKISNISLSNKIILCYYFLVFITLFLGYILKLYELLPYWDIITHSFSHFLLILLGAILLNFTFNLNGTYPKWKIVLFASLFALGCGFLWELVEFSIDGIFGANMQNFIPEIDPLYNGGNSFLPLNGTDEEIASFFKSPSGYRYPLLDTMQDLIWDSCGVIIGATLFCLLNKNQTIKLYSSIKKHM